MFFCFPILSLIISAAIMERGDMTAGQISKVLKEQTGWTANTTYTVIGKLIDKGAVERYGTNFSYRALITREEVQQYEAAEVVDKGACRTCQNRCTSSSSHKTVSFEPDTDCVPVMMNGGENLQQIPEKARISPNNHTLDRRDYRKPKQVLLRVKMDEATVKRRKCIVEHPFGTVKWTHGAHYVLCRGKEKVTAEIGLSFLAYNLRRVINIFAEKHGKDGRPDWTAGVAALICAIRSSGQAIIAPSCENRG